MGILSYFSSKLFPSYEKPTSDFKDDFSDFARGVKWDCNSGLVDYISPGIIYSIRYPGMIPAFVGKEVIILRDINSKIQRLESAGYEVRIEWEVKSHKEHYIEFVVSRGPNQISGVKRLLENGRITLKIERKLNGKVEKEYTLSGRESVQTLLNDPLACEMQELLSLQSEKPEHFWYVDPSPVLDKAKFADYIVTSTWIRELDVQFVHAVGNKFKLKVILATNEHASSRRLTPDFIQKVLMQNEEKQNEILTLNSDKNKDDIRKCLTFLASISCPDGIPLLWAGFTQKNIQELLDLLIVQQVMLT